MLIEMVPLLILYELSIFLAMWLGKPVSAKDSTSSEVQPPAKADPGSAVS
jgi:Sec-independent protein secretion pathway component TatC